MTAPQGAGQVPLCTASEQQEVVHALLTTSQLVITELYCDNTMTLQRHADGTLGGKTERDKKKRHVYNMKWAHYHPPADACSLTQPSSQWPTCLGSST